MTDEDRRIHPLPGTRVFSHLDGEPGTILNRVSPDAYEVMTDEGIEVWQDEDIQAVEEDRLGDFA
jgi:hypothetical protein